MWPNRQFPTEYHLKTLDEGGPHGGSSGAQATVDARRKKHLVEYEFTGASTLNESIGPGVAFKIDSITCHLSAAGTTSEDFEVKKDAIRGATYDTSIYKRDLSVGSVVDLVVEPGEDGKTYEAGDILDLDWPNTETRTYGIIVTLDLVGNK